MIMTREVTEIGVAHKTQEVNLYGLTSTTKYLYEIGKIKVYGIEASYGDVTAYADMDEETEVCHNFDSVGYTYINAVCQCPGADFTTAIQKKGFLGTWSTVITSTGSVMNSSVEYGLGSDSGSGTYRFYLTPRNNNVPPTLYVITISQFYSDSSS